MKSKLRILIIVVRLALGGLFIYGGIQKFIPKERKSSTSVSQDLPDHVVKIKAYIGGLKQTGYFWPMLGIVEILAGVMLVSQYLALLGAVLLMPVTVNIFLFHLFLEPHEVGELLMTLIYLCANVLVMAWHYPSLKPTFLNFKTIY